MLALGCAHQLPRIAAPAIASARLGTAPRPDSSTTPLVFTKAMACFGVIRVVPRAAERLSSAARPAPESYVPPEALSRAGSAAVDGSASGRASSS